MPIFSIVTPVYKAEACLGRCVESVLSQSFEDWELILVDDGSPDNSGRMCDDFARRDIRIKSLHQDNGGPSAARNCGLDNSSGEFILFVDADDYINKDMLEKLLLIERKHKADVCFFGVNPVSEHSVDAPYSFASICGDLEEQICSDKAACANAIIKLEYSGGMGWTWNKLFKHSIIRKHNIRFDSRFALQEDHLFTLLYLCHIQSMAITTYAPYNYVMTSGSLLSKIQTFHITKQLNYLIYKNRLELCRIFDVSDQMFYKWLKTDYATRLVANLLQMKRVGMKYNDCLFEVRQVNAYLNKEHVHPEGRCKYYNYIKRLPACFIVWLLNI